MGGCLELSLSSKIAASDNVWLEELHEIDVFYFWLQVSSIEGDYFSAKELANTFARNPLKFTNIHGDY